LVGQAAASGVVHRKAPERPQGGFLRAFRQRREVPRQASWTRARSTGQALGALNRLGSFRSGYETVSGWVNGQWITRPGKN